MSLVAIAPPDNVQLQSPLLRLPAEIKHIIYGHCFAADGPIVDPIVGCSPPKDNVPPALGTALLQTCRRVYHEADRRSLFARNSFRFTTVDRVRCFFQSLGRTYSPYIQDIEIDAQRVRSDDPEISRAWLHYLAWDGGTRGKTIGSLGTDAPGLKCLRLNFECWPFIPMFRAELWNLLRGMLLHVEGLERIVVIGASKGSAMARREPWSPVHFVGGDDVGSDDLVQRMWRTVSGRDDLDKVIRWSRSDGRLHLEVVRKSHGGRAGPCVRGVHTDPWPENGSYTWFAYQNRDSHVAEPTEDGISPSAAG